MDFAPAITIGETSTHRRSTLPLVAYGEMPAAEPSTGIPQRAPSVRRAPRSKPSRGAPRNLGTSAGRAIDQVGIWSPGSTPTSPYRARSRCRIRQSAYAGCACRVRPIGTAVVEGAAHVLSPRKNVVPEAPVPEFNCATAMLPERSLKACCACAGTPLVPRHSGFDGLILGYFKMGKSSGATRSSMLWGTPG